jgi:hypothetical protein
MQPEIARTLVAQHRDELGVLARLLPASMLAAAGSAG